MILALAGTNGAGKSSVGGAHLREQGDIYYNPDEWARRLRAARPELSIGEANAQAWQRGVTELRAAIDNHTDFVFETTLGGNTVSALLEEAADADLEVRIWYVALASADLHVERVRLRVSKGGHNIPEAKIRERYDRSRENLIRLLPKLSGVHVYDNSAPPDPITGEVSPTLLLRMEGGRIVESVPDADVPEWAKVILEEARRLQE